MRWSPASRREVNAVPSTVMLKASPDVGMMPAGCRVDVADGLLGGGDRGAGLLLGDLQRVLVVGVAALRAGELLKLAFQLRLLDQAGLAGADRRDRPRS